MSALGTRLLNGGVVETRRRAAAAKAAAALGGESSPDEDLSCLGELIHFSFTPSFFFIPVVNIVNILKHLYGGEAN